MEKIASFTVDHLLLEPGVYVSRVDSWQGIDVTTLDLRMVAPNREPPMDTAASIWGRPSCATMPAGRSASSTLVPWVAARASTSCSSVS